MLSPNTNYESVNLCPHWLYIRALMMEDFCPHTGHVASMEFTELADSVRRTELGLYPRFSSLERCLYAQLSDIPVSEAIVLASAFIPCFSSSVAIVETNCLSSS